MKEVFGDGTRVQFIARLLIGGEISGLCRECQVLNFIKVIREPPPGNFFSHWQRTSERQGITRVSQAELEYRDFP